MYAEAAARNISSGDTKAARLSDKNYAGYDYIGFDIIGSTTSERVKEEVALANEYAERDGARGVFITEFGILLENDEDRRNLG